jgi:endonuclease YncB( thermonuclease family)
VKSVARRIVQIPRVERPRGVRRFRARRFRLDWLVPVLLVVVGAIGALLTPPEAPLPGLAGRPTVVDGDTLRFGGERVRLLGIDAPELDQTCTDRDGKSWACGAAARAKMRDLTRGDVACEGQRRDKYGRILANCTAGGRDLAAEMVSAGLAVADGDYFGEEAAARQGRLGIWQGPFTPPAEYRREAAGEDAGGDILHVLRRWFR